MSVFVQILVGLAAALYIADWVCELALVYWRHR